MKGELSSCQKDLGRFSIPGNGLTPAMQAKFLSSGTTFFFLALLTRLVCQDWNELFRALKRVPMRCHSLVYVSLRLDVYVCRGDVIHLYLLQIALTSRVYWISCSLNFVKSRIFGLIFCSTLISLGELSLRCDCHSRENRMRKLTFLSWLCH